MSAELVNYHHELEVATQIAQTSGDIMLRYFDGDQQKEIKTDGSPVTVADTAINDLVIRELAKAFPNDGVVGEEASTDNISQERLWFCDPIDGTKGYVWGVPTAMFSLGLVVGHEPVMGVAYDPFLNRLYTGIVGEGSFCNSNRLHVTDETLSLGTVAVTSSVKQLVQSPSRVVRKLVEQDVQLATFSGAVYKSTLVASGKLVAYIEDGVNPHDMAAVQVIVSEAGGKITAIDGSSLDYRQPFKGALVSNALVHDELIGMAKGADT